MKVNYKNNVAKKQIGGCSCGVQNKVNPRQVLDKVSINIIISPIFKEQ